MQKDKFRRGFVTGFTIEDIETIDVDILEPHCTPSFSWGCRVWALVDAVSDSCVRSSAAWRSRSSAVRNLASHTQSAPARSALIRCQAASLSNLPIVSHGSSDINVTSRKDTDRFQVALGQTVELRGPPISAASPGLSGCGSQSIISKSTDMTALCRA